MNLKWISLFVLLVVSASFSVIGADFLYQTGNGKTFYVKQDQALSSFIEVSGPDFSEQQVRDARWRVNRVELVTPFGSNENIIFLTVKRLDGNVRALYLKPSLAQDERQILTKAKAEILRSGAVVRRMVTIGDELYILTSDGLWRTHPASGAYEKVATDVDWNSVTELIAVGPRLVGHNKNGTLFSLTKTDTHFSFLQVGMGWGETSELIAVDAEYFLVRSPKAIVLQRKAASSAKNNQGTGISRNFSKVGLQGVPYGDLTLFEDVQGRLFALSNRVEKSPLSFIQDAAIYENEKRLIKNSAVVENAKLELRVRLTHLDTVKEVKAILSLKNSKRVEKREFKLTKTEGAPVFTGALGSILFNDQISYAVCITTESNTGKVDTKCREYNEHVSNIVPRQIKKINLYSGKSLIRNHTFYNDGDMRVVVDVKDYATVKDARVFVFDAGSDPKEFPLSLNSNRSFEAALSSLVLEPQKALSFKVRVEFTAPGSDDTVVEWSNASLKGQPLHVLVDKEQFFAQALRSETFEEPKSVQIRLSNVGNTCYVNSLVSLLANHNVFDDELKMAYLLKRTGNTEERVEKQAALACLVNNLRKAQDVTQFYLDTMRPFSFLLGYRGLQQDPIEDLLVANDIMPNDLIQTVRVTERNYDHLIDEHLRAALKKPIISENNQQPVPWLSIVPLSTMSVSGLIEESYLKQTVEKSGPFVTKSSFRFTAPAQLPAYVMIKVNRFNGVLTKTGYVLQKDESPIELSEKITLPFDQDRLVTYDLVGSIHHRGASIQSGHYYSHIKHSDMNFRRHDDSRVSITLLEDFVEDTTAVFLLYRIQ